MFYFDVIKALFQKRIKYLIVGGLAVNLYGVPRVTLDIDLIVSMEKGNIVKLNQALKKLNFIPRLPVNPDDLANTEILKKWIDEKNLKAFSFYNKNEEFKVIDIIITHPLDFENAYKHKVTKKIGSIELYLVSIDDLIKMKQSINRPQDISDINLLKKVKKWMAEDR
ncbi:MAG: DUF6036 family nucleotidyltransferase [Candidatus Helarchaeota archaeon]